MVAKKKMGPTRRVVRPRGTPVPMPEYKPKRVPGRPLPAPMPTMEGNYGKPRQTGPKPKKPAMPKMESPNRGPKKLNPLPKRTKGTPVRRKMM
jgi:hypothetical protein